MYDVDNPKVRKWWYALVLYLSGPMTGIADFNYPFFHQVAKELRAAGYRIVNPAELPIAKEAPYETALRIALQALLTEASGIVSLPGWKRSTGACVEHLNAYFTGMPRFVYMGAGQGLVEVPITPEEWGSVRLKLVSKILEKEVEWA